MIRPLRRRHRHMIWAMMLVLPAGFLGGLSFRRSVPMTGAPINTWVSSPSADGQIVWTKSDLFPGHPIDTTLRRETNGTTSVELRSQGLTKPDLLAYWVTGEPKEPSGIPENARLMGSWSNFIPLLIPVNTRGEIGHLILYSLADQQIVAVSRSFAPQRD